VAGPLHAVAAVPSGAERFPGHHVRRHPVVKGNDWTVEDNTGADSVKNGYQVHQVYPGWGIGNVFTGNRAQVNGPGYGIYVQSKRLQTVVACNNVVSAAGSGFSTIACSPA
jgi:hypothetical protein